LFPSPETFRGNFPFSEESPALVDYGRTAYPFCEGMRLTDLFPNERAWVVAIEGGRCLCQNLALRGLASGRTITALSGRFGPVVVRLDGGTLVLGRGTAQKIQVQKVEFREEIV
jgi:Fe2+ transport system protein FeoA